MNRKITEDICLNFSGIYCVQEFVKKYSLKEVDFSDLSGTNCYCDEEAILEIRNRLRDIDLRGIHFLDSGNYHYMSRIWMEKIEEPFQLLVFDHHTDLQPPAFGDILSCGGWIAASLQELPLLRKVYLVGPEEGDYNSVDPSLKDRICFLSADQLRMIDDEKKFRLFEDTIQQAEALPWYVSVDKDILTDTALRTNWSQGDTTVKELYSFLRLFQEILREKQIPLLGMDVCGECDADHQETIASSNDINEMLLLLYRS